MGVDFQLPIYENQTASKLQTRLRGLISLTIYYDHDFWCYGDHRKVPWDGNRNQSPTTRPTNYYCIVKNYHNL